MKKTTKKGFTLVELLVVIAILAILATVSVVGYTAFIERATVSNDENVAAQLNQFLTAMKADSTGKFYNKELVVKNSDGSVNIDKTVANVRKAIKFAIIDSGLNAEGKLSPESAKYDYHFYYDTLENKIVVLSDKDAMGDTAPLAKLLVKADDEDTTGKSNPATCFTLGGRYIFLDNDGSTLAEVVEELFNLETKERLDAIYESLSNGELKNFIKDNIIVSQDGKESSRIEEGKQAKGYFVTEPGTTGKIDIDATQTKNDSYPDSITIPEHVSSIGGSYGDSKVNFEGEKTAKEIAGMIEDDFTSGEITTDSGKKYEINGGDTNKKVVKNKKDETDEAEIKAKWGLFKFELGVTPVENKIVTLDNGTFVAWDYSGEIKFEARNVKERKYIDPDDQSKGFTDKERSSSRSVDQLTFDSISEILSGSNGTYTIANKSVKPTSDSVTITASCSDKSATATLKFVYITGATISVNGTSGTSFELENDDQNGGTSTFTVTLSTSQNITISEITLDTSYTLEETVAESASEKLDITDNQFKLASGVKDLYDATTITAKVGGYFDSPFTVKVYSKSNLTFVKTATANQIKYIGTLNNITIGDLFDLNTASGMTLPTNAEIRFTSNWADNSTMPSVLPNDKQNNSQFVDYANTASAINSNAWKSNAVKFTDGAANPEASEQRVVGCYIVIPTTDNEGKTAYRRISPVVTLKVVEAYNLKNSNIAGFEFTQDNTTLGGYNSLLHYECKSPYYDLVMNQLIQKHECSPINDTATSKSIVLLEDVAWATGSKYYITFAQNCGIYGNCFKFDVSGGRTNTFSIINLGENGWLRDAVVIGPQYSEEKDPWSKSKKYACSTCEGSAGTVAIGGSNVKIDNCYISGGRAPVRIYGSNSLISNTVLFGGAFSNIDNQGVSFTLENVTMINQYDATYNPKIGGGIVISGGEDAIKNTKIQIKGTFTQYNFISEDEIQYLANVALKEEIGEIFNQTRFVFDDDYINSGIVYDKIMNTNTDGNNDGNNYGDVDINVWVWHDTAGSDDKGEYVKEQPTGYGSQGLSKGIYKATIASFDNRKIKNVNVDDYRSQTVFYAPSLINTTEHYQVTWQTTTTTTN